MRELATDAAQEVLGVDGKLLSTLRLLVRPGRLTVDYLAGRRAAQVGPVRTYLVCSALLFALLALQRSDKTPSRPDEFRFFGGASVSVRMNDTTAARLEHTTQPTVSERAQLRMRSAIRAGPARHAELEQRAFNAIPQTFFLMVPAYAAAMWLVAPRPRRHYPAHLCYALHVHAFVFAALAAAYAARLGAARVADASPAINPNALVQLLFAGAGLGAVAYVLLAYRRVYGATWPGTLARVTGSTLLYVVLLATAVVALMILVLLFG